MIPNLSNLSANNLESNLSTWYSSMSLFILSMRSNTATFAIETGTGCELEGKATVSPVDVICEVVDTASGGEKVFGFGGLLEKNDRGSVIPNPSSVTVLGHVEWSKAGCRFSVYWAIRCAVEAMRKLLPSLDSIFYVDTVRVTLTHKDLDDEEFVNSLRKEWNDIESAEQAMALMEPAFYRFAYYERLGFRFQDQNSEQRNEICKRNADRLFKMSVAARSSDAEAIEVWKALFEGEVVNSWDVWREASRDVSIVFEGDLMQIAGKKEHEI